MGMELAAAIIGLTLVGWWVDWKFGTAPTGLIVGAVLGIVGGMYNFIRQALAMSQRPKDTKEDTRPGSRHDQSDPD
jgi:F0F1-type ATP synthase assembly protein I